MGRCQTFYVLFFSLSSRPRAGLATVLSIFFELATNTLNVRNNNSNNNNNNCTSRLIVFLVFVLVSLRGD